MIGLASLGRMRVDSITTPKVSPLQIHTTDRANFRSCRLRWHFSSNLRLNLRPEQTSENLFFGSALHAGLEAYYLTDKDEDAAIIAALDYLKNIWETEYSDSAEWQDRFSELYLLAQGMLHHYHDVYKYDGLEAVLVEAKFEVPIGPCPNCDAGRVRTDDGAAVCPKCDGTGEVLYSFQIDGLVRDRATNKLWILEHKTAAKIEDDTEYLQLDNQCSSYLWGLSVVKPELKIEGVIYNTLRKIAPQPLKVNKNSSLSVDKRQQTPYKLAKAQLTEYWLPLPIPDEHLQFLDLLRSRESSNLPTIYESPFLRRVPVRRTRQELETAHAMMQMEVKEMLDPNLPIYINPNRWNCGGCAFTGPCIGYSTGADVQTMLDGSYISRD